MRPGIFREKIQQPLEEVTVKIRERYRASTYAQLEETASGDSNRVGHRQRLAGESRLRHQRFLFAAQNPDKSIEEIQFLSLSVQEYCQVMQDWRLQSCRKGEIKQCCEYI